VRARKAVQASTSEAWWRRTGTQKSGFRYRKADGKPLASTAALNRIRSMVIPPAWTDVHISPDPGRKIQAYGWDQRWRKQYIYSAGHVQRSDRKKWSRVLDYARVLPTLRLRTNEDLRRSDLDRRKVLATVVRLISRAFFRAGSERYVEENKTFGITTLRKRHVEVDGRHLIFTYKGKRGKKQRQFVADTPLAEVIEELLELPGESLFRYRGVDKRVYNVTATTVNRYLTEILGDRYTAKDLRTFGATVRAATILCDLEPARSPAEAKRNTTLCCKLVASELGNTPAICRKSYIHPAVLEEYELHGRTINPLMRQETRKLKAREPVSYYPEEAALMRFLEKYG
jgi:DNA topoisomerase-1